MLALLVALVAAAPQDLEASLRHLESLAHAECPSPSADGSRFAFVTTLFGSRQAASMSLDGSYPVQLTDEPAGIVAVRSSPFDPRVRIATAIREGRHRLLLLDDEGGPPQELDPAPGDQRLAGFTRDGQRVLFASTEGDRTKPHAYAFETHTAAPLLATDQGTQTSAAAAALGEALQGLVALSPPSGDGRSLLAVVRRKGAESLVWIDLTAARAATVLAGAGESRVRWPRLSADGRTAWVATDLGRERLGVESIALPAGQRKSLYAGSADVEGFAVTEDGHRLAVAMEQGGETVFSVLDLPSLRPQPLAQPPAGALAEAQAGEPPLSWTRSGDRLLFAWRLSDDTTDVWQLRTGFGTASRLTRSPRPGLSRSALVRPVPVREGSFSGWLWRPRDAEKPRVAVLLSSSEVRPVFDPRIAALNFAGLAVLGVRGRSAEKGALDYLRRAPGLSASRPVLLDWDGVGVEERSAWSAVVGPRAAERRGEDGLRALVDAVKP